MQYSRSALLTREIGKNTLQVARTPAPEKVRQEDVALHIVNVTNISLYSKSQVLIDFIKLQNLLVKGPDRPTKANRDPWFMGSPERPQVLESVGLANRPIVHTTPRGREPEKIIVLRRPLRLPVPGQGANIHLKTGIRPIFF